MHHAIVTRLAADTRLAVYDQTVPGDPPTPYLVVRSGVGVARPHRMSIASHWVRDEVTILAVAASPDGCRAAAHLVRDALTGWRPSATAAPLVEVESSPILSDGQPPADPRYTITVIYRTHTPQETHD